MTTYDPHTRRLEPESFSRRDMIEDSIRELHASYQDMLHECGDYTEPHTYSPHAVAAMRDCLTMINTLSQQLAQLEPAS